MPRSQTILITGATDGLGLALAETLAADGADLILHGRDRAKLDRIADRFADRGVSRPRTVTADLADLDQSATWPPRSVTRSADSTCW